MSLARKKQTGDRILLVVIGLLVVLGLIMLLSASPAVAYVKYKDSYFFVKHQLFGLGLGIIGFLFFAKVNYQVWRQLATLFLVVSILLLLLPFVPGLQAGWGKARSWISVFGLFSFQPSEFVKLFFLLYLAGWLEARAKNLSQTPEAIWPFLFVLGIVVILMILQPDLGTLSIIALTSLAMYFCAGGRWRHIITIGLVGIISLFLLVQIYPYQKDRFRCLINPDFDSQKTCYQTKQSLIALGSGGLWGRGLGQSRQKYLYLPEVVGDSIFAVIGEETGFVFGTLIILLFVALFWRGVKIAKNSSDNFARLVSFGIVFWLTTQALINIGGTVNALPMTGVPLPFISYGGTALAAVLSASGLLYNISKFER